MRFVRLSDIQHSTLFSSYFSQLCRFVVVCSCTTLFQPGLFQWLISSKDYILDVFHYIRCVRIFECYEDQNGQFTERFLPCTCLCCLVPLIMHFCEEQDTSSMTDQRPFLGVERIYACPLWKSPWYNRTGWLGVKHQLTYLPLWKIVRSLLLVSEGV